MKIFTKINTFSNLKYLSLRNFYNIKGNANIGSCGIKLLIKMQQTKIQGINLSNNEKYLDLCNIGDEGAKHLMKGNWQNLEQLIVCKNSTKKREQWHKIGRILSNGGEQQMEGMPTFRCSGIWLTCSLHSMLIFSCDRLTRYDCITMGY